MNRRNPAIVRVSQWFETYNQQAFAMQIGAKAYGPQGDRNEIRRLWGGKSWAELHDVRQISVKRRIAARDRCRWALRRKGAA